LVKSYGERQPKCGTQQVSRELAAALSTELRDVLEPLLREIESLNERIKEYDERIEKIAKEVYPQVSLLKRVKGVGTQIALTYVLTIEDPHRFLKSLCSSPQKAGAQWLADRLLPAVYLSIIGLPQSGKSTLLELLSMICRQPLLVSDISEAAVFRTCQQFSPTLIIDEVEWHRRGPVGYVSCCVRALVVPRALFGLGIAVPPSVPKSLAPWNRPRIRP
jgi:hypothetical protein